MGEVGGSVRGMRSTEWGGRWSARRCWRLKAIEGLLSRGLVAEESVVEERRGEVAVQAEGNGDDWRRRVELLLERATRLLVDKLGMEGVDGDEEAQGRRETRSWRRASVVAVEGQGGRRSRRRRGCRQGDRLELSSDLGSSAKLGRWTTTWLSSEGVEFREERRWVVGNVGERRRWRRFERWLGGGAQG